MKHRTRKLANRWLAMVLCLCMIFPSAVTLVSAAEEVPGEPAYTGGICEHHPEHTEDCGYVEAVEGKPCQHEHTEDCYGTAPAESEEPVCSHVHDENCGYAAPTEGTPCNHEHTEECFEWVTECVHEHTEDCYAESSVSDNTATPSNSEERELICTHECSEESGCITQKTVCQHEHDSECGYSEGTEGTPCGHIHDESCGYLAAKEPVQGSGENELVLICPHANGEHDEACGYVEAVEGHSCEYVCPICSGMQNGLVQLTEDDIEISMTNPVGYVGQEYNLLEKATVTPEQDEDGNEIQLRITDLKANPEDAEYEWNNPTLTVTENKNVSFTVTYEAYVELADVQEGQEAEKVLATKQFTFPVYASGEIGDRLDGDYAYISDAYLVEDEDTESKLAIRTGTAPWDEDDSAGNDSSAMNNTVRSFDVVTYTAAFKTQVRSGSPYTAYKAGTVYYEFVVEGTEDLVRFETESMGWMTAKSEGKYEVTEETHDGKTYQVLRGSFLAEPADGNPAAIGNSYQELNIALRVLAMKKDDTVKPQFTFWLEGNDVPKPEEGLVTGSSHSCAEHDEQEYKTITAPGVSVTSAPRFNVQLSALGDHYSYVDKFDFKTGNPDAANKNAGEKQGRVSGYGITLQIQGKSPQHGLRGCELPDGSDITLDLDLSSIYRTDTGEEKKLFDEYPLLLWSIEGNSTAENQVDGRALSGYYKSAFQAAPGNKGNDSDECYNGGNWKGSQNGNVVSIVISDYDVDLTHLPYRNSGATERTYTYYDPNEISAYWQIQNACFSAGEVWLVQPFYDEQGNYVADQEGRGTFSTTVKDVKLKVTGESGDSLKEVIDNSNQMTLTDDLWTRTVYLTSKGYIDSRIRYTQYNNRFWSSPLTDGCEDNGKDWILNNGKLSIATHITHSAAEGINTGVAYDTLIKFDDDFFQPDGTSLVDYSGENTLLFGAKLDKKGWDHNGKKPNEAGYDTEMMQATADNLIFFSSLDELERAGYICVAVLLESRGIVSTQATQQIITINGTVAPDAQSGSVYMSTISNKAWNKENVQEATAKYLKKDESSLTDEDYNTYVQSEEFPSRANETTPLSYETDYPSSFWTKDYENVDGLRTYKKAIYNKNGFVDATGGTFYGDSCLVVDYATQITKSPNQPATGEGGKKLIYDMDTSQREVDYVLYPTAIRSQGESTTEGTSTTTTVYIEDTLPAGLEYIQNSAFYGGTYTSNGGGRAGTVTGGQRLLPAITPNADGTTTLLFTLENVTITEEEITRLEPIYYSCLIGTPGNEETDVKNQQELLNSVKIWSDDEQIRDFVATNGNYAEQSIIISKNRGVSFSKTSDQKIVEVGDEMGFTIHHGNNSSNSMDVVDIDFLPHNEDGRGTHITGQVIVSELTVQSKELINGFKLYYTTDTSKRNTTAGDYQASDFTEANGWTEMKIDPDTGAVELPDVTHVIVAVAAVGKLTPNSTLKMHITFEVPDGKPGEFLVNSFGSGDMESNARTYIVNRLLEGVVWLDADKDGLRESGETLMSGVKVTLLQKGEDGTYQPYLLDGKAVSVETGKQINVLTGETSDNTRGTGAYGFHHLPQGDFAVQFESGKTVKLGDYTATQENVGTNDTIDSDATAQEQDGKLVSARIEGIEMPAAKEITVQTYESRYHDLGLYASQINIPVEKVWEDNNNQDGKRPGSVTVTLYANNQPTDQTLTLSEANGWKGTFENLDEFKDGEKINYTVEEASVSGYTTVVTGDASTGFTITNSYTPETISISGSKTWDDANDQDGKRPESITVSLLADGSKVSEKEVTASDNWTWTFENLPKYKDGKLINYTIQEETVPGYTPSYSGYNVTNSYTPGKVVIPVTKSWQDNNDQDGLRPQSVTVKLLADGKDTGKTLILSEGNGWSGTFTGLDEYAAGEKIAYTVEEVAVNGYDTAITGDASNGFTITNAHNPETITLSGAKTWNDADNQDGKRPDSITIRLYANGTELKDKAVTVTADDGWKWSFAGLPKYADGKEITYTISEDAVDGYTPAYTDFDVTNTYTPEQTSITVTKAWADNNDQDGLRPESITVKLLADGADTKKTLTLSSGNNWTGTFNNLDKYRDGGEEIVYTIEEVEVSGYDTVISGDASKGFVITNSHTPATTEVSGSKTWDDANDQDGKRPDSITIRLYANGKQVDTKTVTAKDDWKWSFTNLPKYADGKEITYTITEDTVPGYTSEVDGYNVTNSYTPGKASVTVTKAWNDAGNQDGLRPAEITVKLLADGKDTGKTLTLSKENRWMGIFTDLDEYKDGQKIVYTVEEVSVKGYDSVITGDASTGFVITNSHTPEEIDLSGSKTWDDAENQDGKRPDSITIRLYANGEQVKVVTVTADDGWKWNFTNLPKYENGEEIRYTITEDVVPGYQSEVDGMDVTNHYTPGQINIPVTKNWQDRDDADGIRPDSITVKLYADGKDTGRELVLDQENNWTGSFDELDEYAGGVKIVYTIAEVEVDGYDTAVSGSAETGFVISNSHTPDDPDDPDDPDEPTTPTDPDEPDKPNPPKDDTPQTGDTTNLAQWIGLLAISATGFTATLVLGKKKRYRGKYMR